jgi:hypothetical protein
MGKSKINAQAGQFPPAAKDQIGVVVEFTFCTGQDDLNEAVIINAKSAHL